MDTPVRYELDGKIATITMDDGKRNALTVDLFRAIDEALARARTDQAVAILTGKPGTFSAGFDTRVLGGGGQGAVDLLLAGFEFAERLLASPIPIVAACGGHALAMGSFLLLCADYRIGADGPYKIGANEVAIGMIMPMFGIEISRQRLTPSYFHRSVINAEIHTPAKAVEAGFLDRIVPEEQLLPAAREVAAQLASLNVTVHTATKLRAREQALKALRSAIATDEASFEQMFGAKRRA